jgi:hypothetical protein
MFWVPNKDITMKRKASTTMLTRSAANAAQQVALQPAAPSAVSLPSINTFMAVSNTPNSTTQQNGVGADGGGINSTTNRSFAQPAVPLR